MTRRTPICLVVLALLWTTASSCARGDLTAPSPVAGTVAPSFHVVAEHVPSSIDSLIGRFESHAGAVRSSAILAPTGLIATVVRPMITLTWIAPAGGPGQMEPNP